ncbi:cell filamentation protein Fic [Candidatus Paracaedimonas acanthamoebae]|nr:cell filamentation protein Fic [Candidatus Paracaedimonas acanthamoebae]
MNYKPPFVITPKIFSLSQEISHILGTLEGARLNITPIKLRKENNIKTIQASLSIEGNTLSLEQVSHILEGKAVIGPQKDILEVQNAIETYSFFDELNPLSIKDLLRAHKLLMKELIEEAGQWRSKGVGIFKGSQVKHMSPQAKRVPTLMEDLFGFLKNDKETPWLLKACIFHYELEFIHPFSDGNGRMGRLWQQLILGKENPIFKYVTVEELIKARQGEYYSVLAECDQEGASTKFIEFSLMLILEALQRYRSATTPTVHDSRSRLDYAKDKLSDKWFSRKDYLDVFKDVSTATASRDLLFGVKEGVLKNRSEKNQTRYHYLS